MTKATLPHATAPGTEEIYCISYLRGLAALGVVLFHARSDLWIGFHDIESGTGVGGPFDRLVAWLSLPTLFMGSGVMLFFVISGFCIHVPYAGPKGKRLDMKEYVVRRLFRIYPPYLAAILFAFGVQTLGYRYKFLGSLNTTNYALAVPMLQNSFASQPECNPALWTIPIEVTFYLVFPLVYFGLKRFYFATLAAGLVVSVLAIASGMGTSFQSSFLPYWFTWIIGAALAEYYRSGNLKPPSIGNVGIGVLAFTGAIFCSLHEMGLLGSFFYGIAYGVLLWWSLLNGWFYQLLPGPGHRALMVLGAISYSLYLFHTPLFRVCAWAWLTVFGQKPVNYLMISPFVFLAIGLAWLAYQFIEAPSHEAGRKMAAKIKSRVAP